jgi:hypothetical protein
METVKKRYFKSFSGNAAPGFQNGVSRGPRMAAQSGLRNQDTGRLRSVFKGAATLTDYKGRNDKPSQPGRLFALETQN